MRTLHIHNDCFLLTNILSVAFFRSHFVFCIAISWIHFVCFGLVISFLVWICTKNNSMAKIAISNWYQFKLFKTFFSLNFFIWILSLTLLMIDSQERVVKIASYYRELYGFGSGILSSILNLDPRPDPSRPTLRFSLKNVSFSLQLGSYLLN